MNYNKKYLKYKKKYLNLKKMKNIYGGNGHDQKEANNGETKTNDIKKGLAIIFIPNLTDDFFYSDAFFIYDMCSKLNIFDNDRVYITGDKRFENITSYSKVQEQLDKDKLPEEIFDLNLRTPSKERDRYLGKFTYLNLNKIPEIIESSDPHIIHYYFITHGNKFVLTMCGNNMMHFSSLLTDLIQDPRINKPNRKMLIYTGSCYGGQFIESIKQRIVTDRIDLNLELYLISEVYDSGSSSFFKIDKNIGNGKILNEFIIRNVNNDSFKFIDIFSEDSILRKYGNINVANGKLHNFLDIISRISEQRDNISYTNFEGKTRQLLQQPANIVTNILYRDIWVNNIKMLTRIFKFCLQKWNNYKDLEDKTSSIIKLLLVFFIKFQYIEHNNMVQMLNNILSSIQQYSTNLDVYFQNQNFTNIFNEIANNIYILNISSLSLAEICYNFKILSVQKEWRLSKKIFYDIYEQDGFQMLSYNYQVYPDGIENTLLKDLFGSVKE